MIYFKIKGIVIYKERIKEADANVYILTKKDGILKIYAQGLYKIQSKNLPLLELGNYLQIFGLKEGGNLKLISVLPLRVGFLYFNKFPYLYLWVFYLLKKINPLEIDSFIWQIILNLDIYLSQNPKIFPHYFIYHFLSSLGFSPDLTHCFRCHRKLRENIYFDGKIGLYCFKCKKPAFQKIKTDDWSKALKISSKEKLPSTVPSFLKIILRNYLKKIKKLI